MSTSLSQEQMAPEQMAQALWLARLAQGQTGTLTVRSGSMMPLLRLGETLQVAPRAKLVLPGDLAVFLQDDRLVCHRIMLPVAPGWYLQKGDRNRAWELVAAADIVGRPELLITPDRTIPLTGPRFRLCNTGLWCLVALRDLARLLVRPLPRGADTVERLFSGLTAAIMARIR